MPRIIKRYSNRKLYDTEDKRYITLEQIAQLVRDNQDIKVIENQTGEDLTKITLSQILLEQEKRKEGKLPKSFFMNLIQRSSHTVVGFMKKNVLQHFDNSFLSEETIEADVDKMVESGEIAQEEGEELKEKIQTQSASFKKRLDVMVENRVQDVLALMSIPSKAEIDRLHERLEQISNQLATYQAERAKETASSDGA